MILKTVKDAALIALVLIGVKLLLRIISPSRSVTFLFENNIWHGVIGLAGTYVAVFTIIYLLLIVKRKF